MRRILTLFILALMAIPSFAGRTVRLQDYMDAGSGRDAMPAIRRALEACRRSHASVLELPADTLRILSEKAFEKYQFISNNDESLKRIAFDLEGMKHFEVRGNGTTLLLTGFISPFSLEGCQDITVSGLTVDYTHTFHSEATIEGVGENSLDVRFSGEYLPRIENGCLYIYDENWIKYRFASLLEFDVQKREPALYARDYWLRDSTIPAEEIDKGLFRIHKDKLTGKVGNILVFGAEARYNPAFFLSDCEGITLRGVTLHHCGGMGVIAQRSRDIELDGMVIEPAPGRMISITADATHFVNCSGYIRMTGCRFCNMKDDHTNIHGLYMAVDEVLSPRKLSVSWHNSGQYGIDFLRKGLRVEIVDNRTMVTIGHATVKNVLRLNKKAAEVEFKEDLPEGVAPKMVIAADDAYPDVLISGCDFRSNRARGLLLGSRGRIVVENNYFHIPGAAILLEGDGNYWFEQSGVRDLTIRGNVFEDGNFGYLNWGAACISVGSGIPDRKGSEAYHRNIRIEGNTFKVFDPRILHLYSVDGLVFRGNTIIPTETYPYGGNSREAFKVSPECKNITIEP